MNQNQTTLQHLREEKRAREILPPSVQSQREQLNELDGYPTATVDSEPTVTPNLRKVPRLNPERWASARDGRIIDGQRNDENPAGASLEPNTNWNPDSQSLRGKHSISTRQISRF